MTNRVPGSAPHATAKPEVSTSRYDVVEKIRPNDQILTVPDFPDPVVLEETTEEIIEIDLPDPFLIPLLTILYPEPSEKVLEVRMMVLGYVLHSIVIILGVIDIIFRLKGA
jgi:hypothetical protein